MKTLSDFCNMEIVRGHHTAMVIYDHDEEGRAIPLMGFVGDAKKTDYEIKEEGYQYYKKLLEEVNKNK